VEPPLNYYYPVLVPLAPLPTIVHRYAATEDPGRSPGRQRAEALSRYTRRVI